MLRDECLIRECEAWVPAACSPPPRQPTTGAVWSENSLHLIKAYWASRFADLKGRVLVHGEADGVKKRWSEYASSACHFGSCTCFTS
jgi:hypothetical protein